MKTDLASVVSRQLPEFIREDYPAFTAFVTAYYEWLKTQQVDFVDARDIDKSLDDYIKYFKKELAVHLPLILEDERTVLPKIKELYLAKGSNSSFKLLFKLMYGKNVEVEYPGKQMLKASDGTWNQEISVFVKVDYGDPDQIVGKLVDVVTAGRTIRVLVDRKEALQGEVDRVISLGDGIYELFLDKRFFGIINVGDKVKYKDTFQATVLPATQKVTILQPGKNFRVGQVFQIQSGNGSTALLKVTQLDNNSGIKYCELIKFGIGYTSDFGVSVLASNSINNYQTETANSFSTFSNQGGLSLNIQDATKGFDEQGYINYADWVDHNYIDSTYAGTIAREFALNYRNASADSAAPAQFSIKLGAIVKYPGYFTTNNGFLDDSIKIQDSFYYQKFSYVVKIDERLDSYKAAVKTLLHPTGMKLFGEFNITNTLDLKVAVECVVKSLGIGIEDVIEDVLDDVIYFFVTTGLVDSQVITDQLSRFDVSKPLGTHLTYAGTADSNSVSMQDIKALTPTKGLGTHLLYSGATDNNTVVMGDSTWSHSTTKALGFQNLFSGGLEDSTATPIDVITFSSTKDLTDSQSLSDITTLNISKPLADTSVGTWSNSGEVWKNSYQAQDYFATTTYVEGLATTFTN